MKHAINIFWVVFWLGILGWGGSFWWHIPTQSIVNLYVGVLTLVWLTGITTIPWNIYFKALNVLHTAESLILDLIDDDKHKAPRMEDVRLTKAISSTALSVAIFLHVITTFSMYALAYYNVWPLGKYAAIISLLVSFLRPADHFYRYCKKRLEIINKRMLKSAGKPDNYEA